MRVNDIKGARNDEKFEFGENRNIEVAPDGNDMAWDGDSPAFELERARGIFAAVGYTYLLMEFCSIEELEKLEQESLVAADIEAVDYV